MLKTEKSYLMFTVTLFLLSESLAYAATSDSSSKAGGALFLPILIAYATRHRPIGGWLFIYYMSLYGGTFVLSILLFFSLGDYNPANWGDISRYCLFIISSVPLYMLLLVEIYFASKLLINRNRNPQNLSFLKYTLLAIFVSSIISVSIDYSYFKEDLTLSIRNLVFALFWYSYFILSKRVQHVLSENENWDYDAFKRGEL